MDKINWCLKQKDGISFIEPNQNLADAYIRKAEESLETMRINKIKDWKITTSYYSIYFSLYAILQRIGIKCEIHTCTIEFAKCFLRDYFNEEDFEFLDGSLKARVDSQYYVNRNVPDEQYQKMLANTPLFLVKCKSIISKLNENKINDIRKQVQFIKEKIRNLRLNER